MSDKIKKLDEKLKQLKAAKKKALENENKQIISDMLVKTYGKNFRNFADEVLKDGNTVEVFINGTKIGV